MPPITALDDSKEVYQLLRRPGQQALSWQDVLASLGRQFAKRNKQFQLSDKNWFLRSVPLQPSSQDDPINAEDFSVAVKVTVRALGGADTDSWYPVEMLNFDDFELQKAEGKAFVSVYGSPPRIAFSGDVTDREFMLWYKPSANRPKLLSDTPDIETDFNTLLVYDTALECGGIVRDSSTEFKEWWPGQRVYLASQVGVWEEIMTNWMKLAGRQGRVYKRTFPFGNSGPSMPPSSGGRYFDVS